MSTEPNSRPHWTTTLGRSQQRLITMSDLLGRKWYPVILGQLLFEGPMGFSDLKGAVDGISSKMLSESLEAMSEEHGLVEREVVNDQPVRVEYSLTDRGEAMEPVIVEMQRWADENLATADDDGSGVESPSTGLLGE